MQPAIKVVAMASEADEHGFIRTSFLLAQLDLAAGIVVKELTQKRSVTVSFEEVAFCEPIQIGDYLLCYAKISKLGKTSIHLNLKIDLKRLCKEGFILRKKVATARAVFVSLDEKGKKISLADFKHA